MKIVVASIIGSLALLQSNGCDTNPPTVPTSQQISIPYQRFVPVNSAPAQMVGVPWSGFFALDTKTGQLCLTSTEYEPSNFMHLPACLNLYNAYTDQK